MVVEMSFVVVLVLAKYIYIFAIIKRMYVDLNHIKLIYVKKAGRMYMIVVVRLPLVARVVQV